MYRIVAAIILTLFYLPIFGSDRVTIDSLDNYINKAIAGRYFPGAQLVIGNSEGLYTPNLTVSQIIITPVPLTMIRFSIWHHVLKCAQRRSR